MSRQDFYKKCRTDYPTFTYQGYSYNLDDKGVSLMVCQSFTQLGSSHASMLPTI